MLGAFDYKRYTSTHSIQINKCMYLTQILFDLQIKKLCSGTCLLKFSLKLKMNSGMGKLEDFYRFNTRLTR